MEWFVMGCLGIGTFCELFLIGHFAGGLYFTFYPTPQGGGGLRTPYYRHRYSQLTNANDGGNDRIVHSN